MKSNRKEEKLERKADVKTVSFVKRKPSKRMVKLMTEGYQASASDDLALAKEFDAWLEEDENEWMGGPTSNIEEDKREEPINQELSDYLNYAPREGVSPKEKKKYKLGVEEEEDKIRKAKRKSIREGGKYKSRGKEKRREP